MDINYSEIIDESIKEASDKYGEVFSIEDKARLIRFFDEYLTGVLNNVGRDRITSKEDFKFRLIERIMKSLIIRIFGSYKDGKKVEYEDLKEYVIEEYLIFMQEIYR